MRFVDGLVRCVLLMPGRARDTHCGKGEVQCGEVLRGVEGQGKAWSGWAGLG